MKGSVEDLDEALGSLHDTILTTGVRGAHLIPDLALLGLARDVFQHAKAVRLLWDSQVPRTAHAAARSAFEAAQEVMFLGTRNADYDHFGARARAGELLDWEYGAQLANQAAVDQEDVEQKSAAVLADEDSEVWSRFVPEKTQVMSEALEAVLHDRTKKKGRQFHWSGKSRTRLPEEFAEATGGDEQSLLIHKSLYNLLSLQAHPAPRIETKSLEFDDTGFTLFIDGDPEEVAGIAIAAAVIAVASVNIVLQDKLPRCDRSDGEE